MQTSSFSTFSSSYFFFFRCHHSLQNPYTYILLCATTTSAHEPGWECTAHKKRQTKREWEKFWLYELWRASLHPPSSDFYFFRSFNIHTFAHIHLLYLVYDCVVMCPARRRMPSSTAPPPPQLHRISFISLIAREYDFNGGFYIFGGDTRVCGETCASFGGFTFWSVHK